ncbi:NYN domain-containing protein [Curvibacter sp. HBC61]|uniref:NYN domain-containing protein n=1 Tax=Curvibacter cyanobacteriorum TaxID=3026422 RepID=A0ABT5MXR2_9BURK|nr:NYN domain-containing protein [Curvibacter sp. HBC61]MDD0837592.1 NYN domain-containing protein [Curvibacter sp. HBC61]
MATPPDNVSMALFCDFENVALGVRDANYEKFDIKPILERLLLKGSIVVKKAYCDWERYKGFKATMHEANFELIEIPHVRQSGKNSADIRLVVDALDLCYTKSHVNTFVIISGDSDFSPLVSKLRENNKQVIGVGVKQSTSDLLIANCDEFIFYDDLVREKQRALARRQPAADAAPAARRTPEEERHRKEALEARRTQAVEMAAETFDALMAERGDSGKIWASVLKEAIKRRRPDFNENYFGFRAFGNLLEEAQARGLMEFGRDEKSGAYVYRSSGTGAAPLPSQASPRADGAPERHDRADRSERPDRGERSERPERSDRAERPARQDRPDRPDRAERGDRGERGDRTERGERHERHDFSPVHEAPERPVSRYFPPEAFAPAPAPQSLRAEAPPVDDDALNSAPADVARLHEDDEAQPLAPDAHESPLTGRRRGGRGRAEGRVRGATPFEGLPQDLDDEASAPPSAAAAAAPVAPSPAANPAEGSDASDAPQAAADEGQAPSKRRPRGGRTRGSTARTPAADAAPASEPAAAQQPATASAASLEASEPAAPVADAAAKPARKTPARPRRPRAPQADQG